MIIVIIGALTFIVSFFKLEKVKALSFIGNFFSFYLAIMLIIQMPMFYKRAQKHITIRYFRFNADLFINFGASLFCFTNQFGIVVVSKIMKQTSRVGMITVYSLLLLDFGYKILDITRDFKL